MIRLTHRNTHQVSDVMPSSVAVDDDDEDIGDEIHLANMAFMNAAKIVQNHHHHHVQHLSKSINDDDGSVYAPASAGFGAPPDDVDDDDDDGAGVLSGIANNP